MIKAISHCYLILFLCLFSGTLAPTLAEQDSAQPKWTSTGSLSVGRAGNTSTLLSNGKVLIAGGYGSSGELSSAELYNPEKGAFADTSDLNFGRTGHTATRLPNGQVLVVGGQLNGKTLTSAELYDPETAHWTATSSLHIGRVYHTATLLQNGMVLVVGGSRTASPPLFSQGAPPGSALGSAELYDPVSKKWTLIDDLHAARYSHAATLLKNGQVLVTGGTGAEGRGHPVSRTELYNPTSGKWIESGNLCTPRFGHASLLLPNGKVLIAGGAANVAGITSTELYDPGTGTCSPTTENPLKANGDPVLLRSGQVMTVGGNSGAMTSAELYNPATGKWKPTTDSNTPHFESRVTLLSDGRVLVAGGNSGNGSPSDNLRSAEVYDPAGKPKQESKRLSNEQPASPPQPSPTYPFD